MLTLTVLLLVVLLIALYRLYQRNRRQQREISGLMIQVAELEDSVNSLQQHHPLREELLSAMAHDVGGPLKFMTTLTGKMQESCLREGSSGQLQLLLPELHRSLHHLFYYTRNLLQYIRTTSDRERLRLEKFDLAGVAERKIEIFQPIAGGVNIVSQIPASFTVYSDPLLVEVILHNLLDNAVKATRRGVICVRLEGGSSENPVLVVQDSGVGMKLELAEYFNRPIVHASGLDRELQTGVGLAIVRRLAHWLSIRLTFENMGTGTCVRLQF